MRLESHCQRPPCLLQFHGVLFQHLRQKLVHYPPGYHHHGGGWTGIPICLVCFSVNLNVIVNFIIKLDLGVPNGKVGLDHDVVINIDLDVPNGKFRYQKVFQNLLNIRKDGSHIC